METCIKGRYICAGEYCVVMEGRYCKLLKELMLLVDIYFVYIFIWLNILFMRFGKNGLGGKLGAHR